MPSSAAVRAECVRVAPLSPLEYGCCDVGIRSPLLWGRKRAKARERARRYER
jgi:hypothetical protein